MKKALYELTNPQKSIWLTEQYFPNTNINNISGVIIINQQVDFKILVQSINIYISQNDSFRIKIILEGDTPKQYISTYTPFDVDIIEIPKDKLIFYADKLNEHSFNLINNNLYKFVLYKFPDGTGAVYISVNHIISDAWTMGLYISGLMNIYSKLITGDSIADFHKSSYVDYIHSESDYLSSNKYLKDADFWTSLLDNEPNHVQILNYDKKDNSPSAARKAFSLDKDIYNRILIFCQENNCSVYTFLMTIYFTYLSKINNYINNVTIGTPVLNRTNHLEKSTAGMFVSMIPFYVKIPSNISFLDFISDVCTTQMSIFRHQKYPFDLILENFRKKFNTVKNLYDITLSYQNVRDNKNYSQIDYSTIWLFNKHISSSFQIHIYDMDNTGILNIFYDYQTSKFSELDIESIHSRVLYIIEQILCNPNIDISSISILPDDEKNMIENLFNNSIIEYPKNIMINDIIDEICKKFPSNIALVHNNNYITYFELKELSDNVAYNLINLGVKPNECVSILFKEKNIDFIIAMLGVLKCGAFFLNIYSGYPDNRISYLLNNSASKYLITTSEFLNKYEYDNYLLFDNLKEQTNITLLPKTDINSTAYVIYTSGSTGNPKGTMQSHKNLINFVYSFNKFLDNSILDSDKFLSVTNVCFDVSIAEIFTPLFYGASLHLYKDLNYSTTSDLCNYIYNNKITFSYFPPSILTDVYENLSKFKYISLNKLLVGVEPIPASILNNYYKLNPNIKIINGYGPSETTICCTMYKFDSSINPTSITPIGNPIGNSKIHILDKFHNLVPINTIGEIFVEGDCVGNGYLNNNELTEENFSNVYSNNAIYKTGDFAKWMYDGNIKFIGRNDNQVKYRGYRIDLGEIENTFKSFNFIKNAFVFLDNVSFSHDTLISFIICYSKEITENTIRKLLSEKLPHYMIPNHIVFVDSFPLTSNGKVDKKSLIEFFISSKHSNYEDVENNTQLILLKLFNKVFNNDYININDNFFELGGDSLIAMKVSSMANDYNLNINAQDFYTYPTVHLLSEKIDSVQSIVNVANDYLYTPPFVKQYSDSLCGNILLTGATGFLGAHILYDLIHSTSLKIYCLVRGNSLEHSINRLKERLNYYFGYNLDKYFDVRIVVINGDFILENLGLSEYIYNDLISNIKTIINTAAIVKHIGEESQFSKFNVESVKNIINFCLKSVDCSLVHISTLSIAANSDTPNLTLSEKDFFIGQDIDNSSIYTKTKFEAENLIYKNISNGLKATIFRLGNITWRMSDGKYQFNEKDNLFYNIIKIIINTKIVPKSIENIRLNISPVDFCSKSIVDILSKNNIYYTYHIFNYNVMTIHDIVNCLNIVYKDIKFIDDISYKKLLADFIKQDNIYSLIDNYFNVKNHKYEPIISYDYTASILNSINFSWPVINLNYLNLLFGGTYDKNN